MSELTYVFGVPTSLHKYVLKERDLIIANQKKHINHLEYELGCMKSLLCGDTYFSRYATSNHSAQLDEMDRRRKELAACVQKLENQVATKSTEIKERDNRIAELMTENEALRDNLENARIQLRSLIEERKLLYEKAPMKPPAENCGITSSFSRIIRENIQPLRKKTVQNREAFDSPMRKWDWLPREVRGFLLDYAEYTDSLEILAAIGMMTRSMDAVSRKELYAELEMCMDDLPLGVVGAARKGCILGIIQFLHDMKSVEDIVCGRGEENGKTDN